MGDPITLEELSTEDPSTKNWENLEEQLGNQDEENKLRRQLEQTDPEEENPDSEETMQTPEMKRKAFLEVWESMRGEKSEAEDRGFKPGAEIYFSHTESKLPPHSDPGNSWEKFKITDVDRAKGTFKARLYGTELKLHPSNEGKEVNFTFEKFKEFFLKDDNFSNSGKPFKLLNS